MRALLSVLLAATVFVAAACTTQTDAASSSSGSSVNLTIQQKVYDLEDTVSDLKMEVAEIKDVLHNNDLGDFERLSDEEFDDLLDEAQTLLDAIESAPDPDLHPDMVIWWAMVDVTAQTSFCSGYEALGLERAYNAYMEGYKEDGLSKVQFENFYVAHC